MDFRVKNKENPNVKKYGTSDLDIAYVFAKQIHKEIGPVLKAIVIFGSTARKKQNRHDLDILLIIDDVTIKLTPEFIQTYRIVVKQIIAKVSTKIHVTTLRLTNFWEYIKAGDPIAINILRDGVPLVDSGLFEPLQALLYQGRIRSTPESMWAYFNRAPQTLTNSEWHLLQATVDLYWAVVDAAHAALIKMNEIPPSPEHAAEMLTEKLVKPGLLDKKHPKTMQLFYKLSKDIERKNLKRVTGKEYDKYLKQAKEFVAAVQQIIKK